MLEHQELSILPNPANDKVLVSFDGNIESIALTYLYSDDQARAVHAATQGIVEVLRKLYKAPALLHELGVPKQQMKTEKWG